MKLGEIKAEALRLMFVNLGEDIDGEHLAHLYNNETYRFYLSNMAGSINRSLSVLEERRVLPAKRAELTAGIEETYGIRFALSKIKDLYDIDRITAVCDGKYFGSVPFDREGDSVILPKGGLEYTAVYFPKVQRVSSITDDNTEIGVPDSFAAVIPYFIKGDLYRSEDPREASEARNLFESTVDEVRYRTEGRQEKVKTVYSQTEDI